jgi:hypothetical protein
MTPLARSRPPPHPYPGPCGLCSALLARQLLSPASVSTSAANSCPRHLPPQFRHTLGWCSLPERLWCCGGGKGRYRTTVGDYRQGIADLQVPDAALFDGWPKKNGSASTVQGRVQPDSGDLPGDGVSSNSSWRVVVFLACRNSHTVG